MSDFTSRLGMCVICGKRVFSDDRFLKSADGYCHQSCITEAEILRA